MKTIKAIPITHENFRPYGSFASMLDPKGNCFPGDATFYPDQVELNVQGGRPITFSPLTVKKPERMIVSQADTIRANMSFLSIISSPYVHGRETTAGKLRPVLAND